MSLCPVRTAHFSRVQLSGLFTALCACLFRFPQPCRGSLGSHSPLPCLAHHGPPACDGSGRDAWVEASTQGRVGLGHCLIMAARPLGQQEREAGLTSSTLSLRWCLSSHWARILEKHFSWQSSLLCLPASPMELRPPLPSPPRRSLRYRSPAAARPSSGPSKPYHDFIPEWGRLPGVGCTSPSAGQGPA